MNLTEQETSELLQRYQAKDGSGLVNYRDFVNKLDTVFSDAVNPTDVIMNARTTAVSYRFSIVTFPNSNRTSATRRNSR